MQNSCNKYVRARCFRSRKASHPPGSARANTSRHVVMWRHSRQRACLTALMLVTAHFSSHEKAAHAFGKGRTAASAPPCPPGLPISDCAGLQALRAPIMEDTSLSFDGTGSVLCDEVCVEIAIVFLCGCPVFFQAAQTAGIRRTQPLRTASQFGNIGDPKEVFRANSCTAQT